MSPGFLHGEVSQLRGTVSGRGWRIRSCQLHYPGKIMNPAILVFHMYFNTRYISLGLASIKCTDFLLLLNLTSGGAEGTAAEHPLLYVLRWRFAY